MKLLTALIGLTTAVAAFSTSAQASAQTSANAASPSFNCDKLANSHRDVDAEWTICRSSRLGRLDRRMANAYEQVRGQLNWRAGAKLRRTQRAWLQHRNSCGDDRGCIARKYRKRIRQLVRYEDCFDHTARPGCVWRKLERHSRRWAQRHRFDYLNGWSQSNRSSQSTQSNRWSRWDSWLPRRIGFGDRFDERR